MALYILFILRNQVEYREVSENEDVTMRRAALASIETPLHGLLYTKNRHLCPFIERFDRTRQSTKRPVEDFARLTGQRRETTYDASMEQVAGVFDAATFFRSRRVM